MNTNIAGLIVGLGNPGKRYARTRHNLGFLFIEALLGESALCAAPTFARQPTLVKETKNYCILQRLTVDGIDPWLVLRPLTYMNLSGQAVGTVVRSYRIILDDPSRMLIVHDELDLLLGRMKLKQGGSTAGHKGLESIVNHLGTRDFLRLRLGIGKPEHRKDAVFVLDHFSSSELTLIKKLLPTALAGFYLLATSGLAIARQYINSFTMNTTIEPPQ